MVFFFLLLSSRLLSFPFCFSFPFPLSLARIFVFRCAQIKWVLGTVIIGIAIVLHLIATQIQVAEALANATTKFPFDKISDE